MSNLVPGTYRAKAVGFTYGETSKGGNQIGVEFVILDETGAFDGERITGYFHFSEKATPYTMKALRLCGWRGDDVEKLDGLGSTEVDLVLRNETWEGTTTLKVGFVNPPGGGGIAMAKPMAPAKLSSFKDQMRAAAVASREHEIPAAGQVPAKF